MRAFWQLPLLAAVIYGFHSLVDSRALPDNSLVLTGGRCSGVNCPVGLPSELGEPKAGAQDLVGVLKRPLIIPRVPVTPPRIGSPKGSPKGGTDLGDLEGAPQNPADPHPGQSSNPADQSHPEAPAIIAGDKPNEPVGTTPKSLLIGESKDFDTLPPKGRQLDDAVHRAIRDHEPDLTLPKLTDHYEVRGRERNLVDVMAKDLEEPFHDIGLDINRAKYSTARVFSEGKEADKGPVVGGRYFDQDRTIVAEDLFAPNDKNPEGKRIRSSDILFSQWEEFASHKTAGGAMQRGYDQRGQSARKFCRSKHPK